ncbi:DMT family transporter [Pseudoduganella sp. R-34]|uniref:DMT family transporter n=1 Tax=unclassified Pseudoduganella TaxID=2637179 RepID=UPI003CEE3128
MHTQQRTLLDYLLLLGIGTIWGGQFLFNAFAVESIPPATTAALRVLIGAATLTMLAGFTRRPTRPLPAAGRKAPLSPALLYALIALFEAVLPFFLIVWGQQHVDSGITAVMMGSVPILTMLLSLCISKHRRPGWPAMLSVLLGFAGIIILVSPATNHGSGHLVYEGAIFLGCASFALSLNLLEHLPHDNPIRSVRTILWYAALPLAIASLLIDHPWQLTWTPGALGAVAVLGTVESGLAYLMYAALVQRRGPVFTSLSNFIVPVVGVLLGVALRGEHFGLRQASALALTIAALAVNGMPSWLRKKGINHVSP